MTRLRPGKTATENHALRVDQFYEVGDAYRQIPVSLFYDFTGSRITGLAGLQTISAVRLSGFPPHSLSRSDLVPEASNALPSLAMAQPEHRLYQAAVPPAGAGWPMLKDGQVSELAGQPQATINLIVQDPGHSDPRTGLDIGQVREPRPAPNCHSPSAAALASLSR